MADPVIFCVGNHHTESCGRPPSIDDSSREEIQFRSYFENQIGEQWIFLYNAKTDRVSIYAGDCGWENELTVASLKDSLKDLPGAMADKLLDAANSQGALQNPAVCGKTGPAILDEAEQI